MKATGIVRRIDDLGRVVIPKDAYSGKGGLFRQHEEETQRVQEEGRYQGLQKRYGTDVSRGEDVWPDSSC